MKILLDNWVLFLPIFLLQLALTATALVHILTHKTYKTGTRWLWIVISAAVNTIGPVLYFAIGRGENEE